MIRRLFNIFLYRNNKKYGGIIAALELEEFWDSLSLEEREFIRECFVNTGQGKPIHLDSPKSKVTTSQLPSGFLTSYAGWAISKKRFDLADKLLNEAIKRKANHIDLHYTYNYLIDLCYKHRNEGPEWLEQCINYCLADIEIFPGLKKNTFKRKEQGILIWPTTHFTAKRSVINISKKLIMFRLIYESHHFKDLQLFMKNKANIKKLLKYVN